MEGPKMQKYILTMINQKTVQIMFYREIAIAKEIIIFKIEQALIIYPIFYISHARL